MQPDDQEPTDSMLAVEMLKRMRQLNMSRRELAIRAGLSRQTLHHIENGRRNLQPQTMAALDAALQWPTGTAQALASGDVDALSYDPITESVKANHYRWQIVKHLESLSLAELEAMIINSGWTLEDDDEADTA